MIFAIYDTATNLVKNWKDTDKFTLEQVAFMLEPGLAAIEAPERIDGPCEVVDGAVVSLGIDQATLHERAKSVALFEANTNVNILRRLLATDIAFQQEAYYKKRAEAEAYQSDPSGYPADFPLLSSISAIRSMTPADLAALWITTADDLWGPILNQTEIVRERAIVAIGAATDQAGIDAALAQLNADIATIQSQG